MNPLAQALQEPHLWMHDGGSSGTFGVRHPNGVTFTVEGFPEHWLIRKLPYARYRSYTAKFARTVTSSGFRAVVQDASLLMPRHVSVQVQALRLDLAAWALSLDPRAKRLSVSRVSPTAWFSPDDTPQYVQDTIDLPDPLHIQVQALENATIWNSDLEPPHPHREIVVDLPTSLHARMDLLARWHHLHGDPTIQKPAPPPEDPA